MWMAVKYKETTNYFFLLDENYYVCDHKEDRETLHIFIKSKRNRCRCPKCGMESRKLHATYERTLQAPYPLQTDISSCECL